MAVANGADTPSLTRGGFTPGASPLAAAEEYALRSPVTMTMSEKDVFFVFVMTQIMQALMSYDGGATSMSTAALLDSGWPSSEIGLLCAMDKFGQVPMCLACGYLLTKYNNKLMVATALFLKAASCLGFGVLRNHALMLLTKFSMGASEAVVGVWGTVWIQGHAPDDSRALWLGLQGVSAGIGSGLGSIIAGLCSESMGYAFAFIMQAVCLFCVWFVVVSRPVDHFDMGNPDDEAEPLEGEMEALTPSQGADDAKAPLKQGGSARDAGPDMLAIYRSVMKNRLWLWTASSYAWSVFMQTGINYLWQNTVLNVWRFTNAEVTISLNLFTGVGGGIGNAMGPKFFDGNLGGFATPAGKTLCLKWCRNFALLTTILATTAAMLFWREVYWLLHYDVDFRPYNGKLVFVFFSIASIFGLLMAMNGTLVGINTESVRKEERATAAGFTVGFANIIGYAFGSMVPMIAADMAGASIQYEYPTERLNTVRSAQFAIGMTVALLSAWLFLISTIFAQRASQKVAAEEALAAE
eukprot:TRINITY_DN24872_c0_g1_i1.p1 TRINITY_DN24872_c0_g1~~TRINITY_DN24872_c0_g1_i1.p1  ORF type:complete len:524 (-),score=95.61 TRINITY_DN24872_c0_g1_i1:144-1715(-)